MFLNLYRVQGTNFWHDICAGMYAEPGEYVQDSGEDPVDFFVWGLSEDWVRGRYEGGYSSRKDSDITVLDSVTRYSSLPEMFPCENTNTLGEWFDQVKFSAPEWTAPFLRPRWFWSWKWNLKHVWRRLTSRRQPVCF